MAKRRLYALNRGIISPLAQSRLDVEETRLGADIQENYLPNRMGSMQFRPGTQYIGTTLNNKKVKVIPFIFNKSQTAALELTEDGMRALVDDVPVSYPAVSSAITNGNFTTDLSGWTDNDDAGAASTWVSGNLQLVGTGFAYARMYQEITVTGGDISTEHAISVHVIQGKANLRIGTSATDDSYITERELTQGHHRFAFTPAGNFFIALSSATQYPTLIDDVGVVTGEMVIDHPWAETDLDTIRTSQSIDVIYASSGIQRMKILRWSPRSWSVVDYPQTDGPFRPYNETGITVSTSAINGAVTLTASQAHFRAGHVGSLILIDSVGQQVESELTAEDQFTGHIKVTGTSRSILVTRADTWVGTLTLQRSIGAPGSWVDVTTYTANGTTSYFDGLDNQIIYYRIGFKTGDWTSGPTTDVSLSYAQGSISGICQITSVASDVSASANVLRDFGGIQATTSWREGLWSDYRGHPSAVALYEGRLWWFGKQQITGSKSDEFEIFDSELEGDSRPVHRTLAFGTVDNINWVLPAQRMLIGTDARIVSAKSSSFDELLTQDNLNLKNSVTQGADNVDPVLVDTSAVYVDASGSILNSLAFDVDISDYAAQDLMEVAPELGRPSIIKVIVQRQPDLRIHCIRSDGKVAVYLSAQQCWTTINVGTVEDGWVLPGNIEDKVYYVVNRNIGGTKRYIERFALASEAEGDATNKVVDSGVTWTGASSTTITGLDHLEGETVSCWANSKNQGDFTVASGQITIPEATTSACVGLIYTGQYKSSKLMQLHTKQMVRQVGLILRNTHRMGIQYGDDFTRLDYLPDDITPEISGVPQVDHIFTDLAAELAPVDGKWKDDTRLCLQSRSPYPCTVVAVTLELTGNEK